MYTAGVLVVVVSVLATKVSIETVKCKRCQVKIVSKQTSSVKLSFYKVLEILIKTLISNVVDPTDILDLLPSEISSRLQSEGATTIRDIFRECGPLDNQLKWYSFPLLVLLVQRFGDDRCKELLQEYRTNLQTYLQTRLIHTSSNCNSNHSPADTATFNSSEEEDGSPDFNTPPVIDVFVDKEWDARLVDLDSNKHERAYLADLLGTTAERLRFIQAT